jgi:hypothetical protein
MVAKFNSKAQLYVNFLYCSCFLRVLHLKFVKKNSFKKAISVSNPAEFDADF